jgi:hypothetical protein
MRVPLWVPLAFFAALVIATVQWGRSERRAGAASVLVAQADSARAVAEQRADSLARAFTVDTVTLTRWRTRTDTLRTTLTLTDTVEVAGFLAAQDSVIAACTQALTTCGERVKALSDVVAAWERRDAALALARPSWWDGARVRASWLSGGLVAGAVLTLWMTR